ncbi:phytanoyl-CoA dioxygenase PhyH [Prauserella shujinwangii]|uniref:Phytanoyl-CoA dioxygenase PhyH n=1 Tax=Prauserella shujinwangii TaxID=1453103 RepID=A0A2T0M3P1_9PSEU|nr:phytanoyl-CoA dioxygenase family protein [Prauserella shujinwangii]PRX51375.1 phytanoyl-CoA dioxygenase PhyH [Prauserella shujinwangii]
MPINDGHLDQLREDGYTLVTEFLDGEWLRHCRSEVARYFPDSEEFAAAPERYRGLRKSAGFPYEGDTLNHVSTHPDLIAFVEQVLGCSDVRLGDSILQAKYGPELSPGNDQRLHNDAWGRNCLVYPGTEAAFHRVFAIVYYTDVTAEAGPTYVVPKKYTEDIPLLDETGNSAYGQREFPELYEREEPVLAPAGSVLLFTGHTVHRGSGVTEPVGHRFAHFLNFHAAESIWLDKQSWAGSPASPTGPALRRFIESATPQQRQLLGFPAPGSPYWNERTLAGVARLYPGMDMVPYETVHVPVM